MRVENCWAQEENGIAWGQVKLTNSSLVRVYWKRALRLGRRNRVVNSEIERRNHKAWTLNLEFK